jgi:hypothetical protein
MAAIVGFGLFGTGLMLGWKSTFGQSNPRTFITLLILLAGCYVLVFLWLVAWSLRQKRKLQQQTSPMTTSDLPQMRQRGWEYRTQKELLGRPLIHFKLGGGMKENRKPVVAWIAAGDVAIGYLAAYGGIAVAPISMGGVAVGLLSFGGCGLGLLALGGLSIGAWAFGGLAIGWQSLGGCAIAWHAAFGGVALAREIALGGIAQATLSNSPEAASVLRSFPFFFYGEKALKHIAWLNLIWLLPMFGWWRIIVRAGRRNHSPQRSGLD